jgi:putative transposase
MGSTPMPHTYTSVLIHAVFATANRRPVLGSDRRDRVHAYLGGIARELNASPIAIGGIDDHVHMLLELPPTIAVADMMRLVKGNSSKWLNETFAGRFEWQRGYGAFSVSRHACEKVASYIRNQEEHHRARSFDDEYRLLLERNGIVHDRRFLWS